MSQDMEKEITEIVDAAKAPGTFNILNVIKNKAYPKDDVVIYLDEQAAYDASNLKDKIQDVQINVDNEIDVKENTIKLDALKAELDEAMKRVQASKYIFTISGISEGKREELFDKAREKFPVEYREERNVLSQETTRIEIESEERDKYLTNLLWAESVVAITAPDGSGQNGISFDDVVELRFSFPPSANIIINQTIEKVRAASAVFLMSVDEDFLAKS
jgi:hypothetical protein